MSSINIILTDNIAQIRACRRVSNFTAPNLQPTPIVSQSAKCRHILNQACTYLNIFLHFGFGTNNNIVWQQQLELNLNLSCARDAPINSVDSSSSSSRSEGNGEKCAHTSHTKCTYVICASANAAMRIPTSTCKRERKRKRLEPNPKTTTSLQIAQSRPMRTVRNDDDAPMSTTKTYKRSSLSRKRVCYSINE